METHDILTKVERNGNHKKKYERSERNGKCTIS